MNTKGSAAIILILIAVAMIGSGVSAQYRTGLPPRTITMPTPSRPAYQPQILTLDPPEYRMAWVFSFGSQFANPTATTTLINRLADNNFNVVVPEIRKRGDAYYNSAYEPWATDVAAGYDPLRDVIDKAHARDIEVWGWIVTYRVWQRSMIPPATHIWARHPEWACINKNGSNAAGSYYNLDPGVPGVQQYTCELVKDVVAKYPDLDGFNFDYIRYDSNIWGYNPISKERFRSEYGYYPPTSANSGDPQWQQWCVWKRRQITNLVTKCYLEAIYINPQIKMTVDTIGWMAGDPNTDFTGVRAYYDVCQDHKGWMEKGIIDVNILMNYKRDWCTAAEPCWTYGVRTYCGGDQQSDHRRWSDWLGSMQSATGVHVVDGIGGYMNVLSGILDQWQYSRANGVGLGMYRYGFTVGRESTTPGKPVFNSNSTTVAATDENIFYNAIKSTMFQNPASIPDMPWKSNPTAGYLFGQVTDALEPNNTTYQNWIYQAAVTAVGPGGAYTSETDATGTYGLWRSQTTGLDSVRLPPGQYSISVSRSGFNQVTNVQATVTAGLANKVDLQLGPVVDPEDFKTISEALDPSEVAENAVIGLEGKVATVGTGTFAGCMYVEEEDRSCAIQIRFGSVTPVVSEGDRVAFIGLVNTVNGERMLTHATMTSRATGPTLGALQSSAEDLDRGPTSTALLVRCTGKVIDAGVGWFTVDDGSGTVTALCTGMIGPARNSMVSVTGFSGYSSGRIIRVRRQSDISVASTMTATAPVGAIGSGFNLISLPYVPTDPTPSVVLGTSNLTDSLFRWDNVSQAFVGYNSADPSIFGKMSPSQGYALMATTAPSVSFQGVPLATDMRISIPKKGWSLIAQPVNSSVLWTQLKVTDGSQTKTLQQAIAAGWIGRIAFTWDTASGQWGYVGTGARGSRFDDSFHPWHAYWITTYQDNLAVIVPASGT